ncbi:MAG: DUF1345 domain-containing protein [Aestuariivirgaceae bacterium]
MAGAYAGSSVTVIQDVKLDRRHADRLAATLRRIGMQAHPRLAAAAAVALVVIVLCLLLNWLGLSRIPWLTSLILSFDAGAAFFIFVVWKMMAGAKLEDMERRAAIEDAKPQLWPIIVGLLATAILISVIFEMRGSQPIHVLIGIATILLSWLFLNTMFAMHYAHDYYREIDSPQGRKRREGLMFPGRRQPDYWDFLYFSFVVGMTFQVSDVQVEDHLIRRVVLLHGWLAFIFNVFVLALSISIVSDVIRQNGEPSASAAVWPRSEVR